MRRIQLERPRRSRIAAIDPASAPHLLIRDLLAEACPAEIGDQLGRLHAEVRRDQRLLELLQGLGVQPAPGENGRNVVLSGSTSG